jgi:hypothetical protein
MLLYSQGQALSVVVGDFESASLVGRYMAAAGRFLETNDPTVLTPFVGQSVRDTSGKEHPLEGPNVRLSSTDEHTFEQVYRIVI